MEPKRTNSGVKIAAILALGFFGVRACSDKELATFGTNPETPTAPSLNCGIVPEGGGVYNAIPRSLIDNYNGTIHQNRHGQEIGSESMAVIKETNSNGSLDLHGGDQLCPQIER